MWGELGLHKLAQLTSGQEWTVNYIPLILYMVENACGPLKCTLHISAEHEILDRQFSNKS